MHADNLEANCSDEIHVNGNVTWLCEANDMCGNTGSATLFVDDTDSTPPDITCIETVIERECGPGGTATVSVTGTASDVCDGDLTVEPVTDDSPIGSTPVTLSATDDAGFSASCTTLVVVSGADTDGDGQPDCVDACPNDELNHADEDGICGDIDQCIGDDSTLDVDNDGYCTDQDCRDDDADADPGAEELCNGLYEDCDDEVPVGETDSDGDLFRICDGDCDGEAGADEVDSDGVLACDDTCDEAPDIRTTACEEPLEDDSTYIAGGCSCDASPTAPFSALMPLMLGGLLLRRRRSVVPQPHVCAFRPGAPLR
jgi:MYXO-CTERM domain-containing protein